jgi:hypothetical protein
MLRRARTWVRPGHASRPVPGTCQPGCTATINAQFLN